MMKKSGSASSVTYFMCVRIFAQCTVCHFKIVSPVECHICHTLASCCYYSQYHCVAENRTQNMHLCTVLRLWVYIEIKGSKWCVIFSAPMLRCSPER